MKFLKAGPDDTVEHVRVSGYQDGQDSRSQEGFQWEECSIDSNQLMASIDGWRKVESIQLNSTTVRMPCN